MQSGSVVCIGAFDGLHLGHQKLISQACIRGRALGLSSVAITFEPLPREFFSPDGVPRLMGVRDKCQALFQLGVEIIGLLRFDTMLSKLAREEFVEHLLVQRLKTRETWTGSDFRFGRGNMGDFDFLRESGRHLGFHAQSIGPQLQDGHRISSSDIRQALRDGKLEQARQMLGRRYSLSGRLQQHPSDIHRGSIYFPHLCALSGPYRVKLIWTGGQTECLAQVNALHGSGRTHTRVDLHSISVPPKERVCVEFIAALDR